MSMAESLRDQILREQRHWQAFSQQALTRPFTHLMEQVKQGAGQEALESLIFFTSPLDFPPSLEMFLREMRACFSTSDEILQTRVIRFLADLTLSLRSFLPRWNLQNVDRHAHVALTDAQIQLEAEKVHALVAELAAEAPNASARLLAEWQVQTTARLEAEQASNPEREGKALVGESVGEYLLNLSQELANSNLRRISQMRAAGKTLTELSNDYAAFLQYALYLGASFVTCNPPLVDLAWLAEPERWNPVVDGIITDDPEAGEDELARLVTMEVVLVNMRLLRPIYLLTEGRMGCVCLQVNPHNHGDAAAMVSDALFIYARMRDRLGGGVPNVVFKLPGTQAGLTACRALTQKGIGTTITVNFGMFQHLPFAQAIEDGQSIFSCLVEMSGRLAYPVRDELLAKLDALAVYGIDQAKALEAAAWSGVAVLKRLHRVLKDRGHDLRRIKLLVASLRIYEGAGYEGLPNAFPDITEVLGASIISVFPNIRRPFDEQPGIDLSPVRIEAPVPDHVLEVLAHSEIFKQAYYVAEQDWSPDGNNHFRPERELTLEDEAATAAWAPVHDTLTQFCDSYDTFVQRILERKDRLRL